MKKYYIFIIVSFLYTSLKAQVNDEVQKYIMKQNEAFNKYMQDEEEAIQRYNDSINMAFGKYLAENWPEYKLERHEIPIKEPVPLTVYDPSKQPTEPMELLPDVQIKIPQMVSIPLPPAEKDLTIEKMQGEAPFVSSMFYGATIAYPKLVLPSLKLAGINEGAVADCWNLLSSMPYSIWTNKILQQKEELQLNDWALYLLVRNLFKTYFPKGNLNEEVVFTVFTLNQLGYRAKIGRGGGELMPLLAMNCNVNGGTYFYFGRDREIIYWAIQPNGKELPSIRSCSIDYENATRVFDMNVRLPFEFPVSLISKEYKVGNDIYKLSYNKNVLDLYSSYPCIDYPIYAQAALDNTLVESISGTLCNAIHGLSQEDAINKLLNFVQYAFEYKTDFEQFGLLERCFFGEETIASQYSDCEDRAILFSQLVRHLLGMPIVLVHYKGRHLATAVSFDNPDVRGDYVLVDNKKYLICDPTFIGAKLGRSMPKLKDVPILIYKLK